MPTKDDLDFARRMIAINAQAADSPDYYSPDELREMLKAFEIGDPEKITRPGVPFSLPEIQRALLRAERNEL